MKTKQWAIWIGSAMLMLGGCHSDGQRHGMTVLAATGHLTLSWENNDTGDGIYLQRREGASGDLATIATVDATVSSYVDQDLEAATEYCYRVGAFNSAGVGWSQVVCATSPSAPPSTPDAGTPDASQPLPAPADFPVVLTGRAPEQKEVTLQVNKPAGAIGATLRLLQVEDPDFVDEGTLTINGHGPVVLFGDETAGKAQTVDLSIDTPVNWWRDGANVLTFTHDRTGGYTIGAAEVVFDLAPPPAQADAGLPPQPDQDAGVATETGSGDASCRIVKHSDDTSEEICELEDVSGCAMGATPSGLHWGLVLALLVLFGYRRAFGPKSSFLLGVVAVALQGISTAPAQAQSLPEGDRGIAATYRSDVGIASDPAVVFTENFESVSGDRLDWDHSRWDNYWGEPSITRQPAKVHSGAQGVEMNHRQRGQSKGAWKDYNQAGFDRLFVRYYMKYHAQFPGLAHTGMMLFAGAPGVTVAQSTGRRPNGTNHFNAGIDDLPPFVSWSHEGNRPPGYSFIYSYHMDQGHAYGDNLYPSGLVTPGGRDLFGGSFVPRPDFILERDRWYCFELMVQANTPGLRDGRIAFWVDGGLKGDFPNLRFRSVDSLKLNRIVLSTYAEDIYPSQIVWYDDIVAATSYIGPMSSTADPPIKPPQAPTGLRIMQAAN